MAGRGSVGLAAETVLRLAKQPVPAGAVNAPAAKPRSGPWATRSAKAYRNTAKTDRECVIHRAHHGHTRRSQFHLHDLYGRLHTGEPDCLRNSERPHGSPNERHCDARVGERQGATVLEFFSVLPISFLL